MLDKSCQYVIDRRVNSSGSGFSMESLRCNVTSTFVNDVTPPFLPAILCIRDLGGRRSFQRERDYFSHFYPPVSPLVPESSYRNKPCPLSSLVSLRGEINYRGGGEGVDVRRVHARSNWQMIDLNALNLVLLVIWNILHLAGQFLSTNILDSFVRFRVISFSFSRNKFNLCKLII